MNKTARLSNLGKLITSQNIASEAQLNQYVLNNLTNNLFDHRDYQETIEYFRENIRSFKYKYSDVINGFCRGGGSDETDGCLEDSELYPGSMSSLTSTGIQRRSFSLDAADAVFEKSYDSMSNDEMENSSSSNNNRGPDEEEKLSGMGGQLTAGCKNSKSHLRIIYEWLRGLYLMQTRKTIDSDVYRRSNSCYNKATAFQRLPSSGNLGQSIQ